jgi:hypothetical protein
MARFGRQFLQQMASPTFGKGLFDVAQKIGEAPAKRRQMGMLRDMGSVERADYMASIAETPQQLMQATAAKNEAMRQSALTSLNGLEAARQAAGTDAEKKRIEGIMSRVAVQAGVDPVSIAGRTQKEQDATLQRQMAQMALEDKERQQQEQTFIQAYYAVPEDKREAFEEKYGKGPFSDVINELREDKAKDELFNLQLENARTKAVENAAMKKAPLPTSTLRERIEDSNIAPELRDQFLSELNDIEEPNFDAGETWNPGQRKLAIDALESLNTAVRNEIGREVSRKSAVRTDIRRLEKEKTKGPSFREIQAMEAEAKDALATEWWQSDPSEEEITAKATQLAALAKQDAIQELIDQRYAELGESPEEPATEPEEEKEEETKQIGGYTVKEVRGS